MQYEFFDDNSEIAHLRKELDEVRERSENARKGLFARHNELLKLCLGLKEEVEQVKALHANKANKAELFPFFTEVIEKY